MFKHSFKNPRTWPTRFVLVIALVPCLAWLALSIFRPSVPDTVSAVGATSAQEDDSERTSAPQQMKGEEAREYLEQTGEGQSLMAAVTAARFGLKWQERAPFGGESGGGYLGMSHDQNLNAWFDEEGATIRPTVPEKERAQAWQLGLRLKAYGYGEQMQAAPPVTARNVKDNRIEYVRAAFRVPPSGGLFALLENPAEAGTLNAFIPQSAIRNPKFIEWYENRAEGIEQGFTFEARPVRSVEVGANEPLRMLLGVSGDLRARAVNEGQQIELVDAKGKGALSYSKLTAQDADGKQLAARMEASVDGREIVLVVEDEGARYPIVIDPVVATLEKKLDAAGFSVQADARFGFAVAIDGDRAVVGAWREDFGSVVDAGAVYTFSRTGSPPNSVWSSTGSIRSFSAGPQCGWSVAISGTRIVYGCPGANGDTGRAFLYNLSNSSNPELIPPAGTRNAGERYGASVAISGSNIVVGAPFHGSVYIGAAYLFTVDSNFSVAGAGFVFGSNNNDQLGTSVGADSNTFIAGAPGVGAGRAYIFASVTNRVTLQPNDGAAGDQFGQSVAISGNTAVVGAPLNGEGGNNAGAAYVFGRDPNGNWSQQQKLTASDAHAGDIFGADHIAIQGNTIIVGSNAWDGGTPPFILSDDNRGAVYVFTRSDTVWTQQARILANDGDRGDNFGVSVGISGNSVIAGARGATASGVQRAGAAYVYRLDCVPPYGAYVGVAGPTGPATQAQTVCPGTSVSFYPFFNGTVTKFQWRKNGVSIPGATLSTYTLPNVSSSDAGSYDVIVSNACGSDISSPATLSVYAFSLNPTSQNSGAGGSDGLISVTSTGSCPYTAVPNSSWIKITSNGSGTAPQNVGFHVDTNTGPNQRTGSITIGDKTFTVTQDGLNCSYSISPTSQNFGAAGGGPNSVTVTATAGCAWTATSNDPTWLSINAGASGTGNGTVGFTVAANANSGQRTGTITIAGLTFTVTQDGLNCSYSIAPTSQSFTASGGTNNSVSVTAAAGCAWTAQTNAPSFITITSGNSGTGPGTVNYSVTASTGPTRTGTMTIAGQIFTVTQDGASLVSNVQFNGASVSAGEGAGFATITVTRTGDTSTAVTVDFETSDVGARQRTDYTLAAGTLTFAPGDTSKTFRVLIVDDVYIEGNETLNLTLSNPTGGAVLGNPSTAVLTITDNDSTSATTNPLDGARFFVQQHYYDFLSRFPDTGGWDFWSSIITSCGTDPGCINNKRIDVSNAFYYELEFQQTGSYAYRLYRAAFGNNQPFPNPNPDPLHPGEEKKVPLYLPFIKDRARVRGGPQLAQFQLALASAFVERAEFTNKYPLGLSGPGFVDALLGTINNDLGVNLTSQRQALIDLFNAGGRGNVLYRIADDNVATNPINNRAFIDAEYNRAFVFTQYAGYLRRNPDMAGFLFWLGQVNSAAIRDVAKQHAMVCSFITSSEYQQRFSSVVTHNNTECGP